MELEYRDFMSLHQISFSHYDKELVLKVKEKIEKEIWLRKCKKCKKEFPVNSPTHKICWRCNN